MKPLIKATRAIILTILFTFPPRFAVGIDRSAAYSVFQHIYILIKVSVIQKFKVLSTAYF